MVEKEFKHFYKLIRDKHYKMGVNSLTGQDWSPFLIEDTYKWLQNNMKYGVNYIYHVENIDAEDSREVIVGLDFATTEDVVAFKLACT